MKKCFRSVCLLSLFIFNLSCAESPSYNADIRSGKYEQVSIAINGEGRLTGYFKEDRGDSFSCYFGFSGHLNDGEAVISVDDEGFKGRLHFEGNNLVLAIPEAMEIPGCDMILLPIIAEGVEYGPKVQANWIEIKIIPKDGVALRNSADSNSEVLEVMNQWHVLGVLEEKNNWSKVSYYKLERVGDEIVRGFKEGWVESSALKSIK